MDSPSRNGCKNLLLGPPQVTSHVPNHPITRIRGDLERPNHIPIAFYPRIPPESSRPFATRDVGWDDEFPRLHASSATMSLEGLHLLGECRHVFRLLERLEYPDTLESVDLKLLECVAKGISEFLPPHLQDCTRRDGRFQSRLGIRVSPAPNSASFNVGVRGGGFNTPTASLGWHGYPSISFRASFRDPRPRGVGAKLCTDLITLTPREYVVDLTVGLSTRAMRDLVVTMPNIEDLYLIGPAVSNVFLQSNSPSRTNLLPSLRHLRLGYFTPQDYDD